MSGRWVPPRYGSLTIQTSPGLGLALDHRGDRLGHRAEVDGDVLGLGDHRALGVEQRGRAVAALLDVGGVGAADQHRARLLGDARQRAGEDREGDGIEAHVVALQHQRAGVVDRARPARPHDAGRLGELDDRRALDLEALAHAGAPVDRHLAAIAVEVAPRARPRSASPSGSSAAARASRPAASRPRAALTSSTVLAVHRVAVAALVRLGEALLRRRRGRRPRRSARTTGRGSAGRRGAAARVVHVLAPPAPPSPPKRLRRRRAPPSSGRT